MRAPLEVLGDVSAFANPEDRDDDVLSRIAVLTLPVGRVLLNHSPAVGADKTA
jgi:hypothetical protein